MSFIREKLGKMGIYIFFTSLALFSQTNWLKSKNSYDSLEFRIFMAIVLGVSLSAGVFLILEKILYKYYGDNTKEVMNKLSFSLSPGFLFLFASNNMGFLYLGIGLSIFMVFNSFLERRPKGFINTLVINDNVAEIKVEGVYTKKDTTIMKAFLDDLVLNLNECVDENVLDIKVNFSRLKESDGSELKQIINDVAKYFDVELSY